MELYNCSICGGDGWDKRALCSYCNEPLYIMCTKCYGKGKLDWIENIIGRKREPNSGAYGSTHVCKSRIADSISSVSEVFERWYSSET